MSAPGAPGKASPISPQFTPPFPHFLSPCWGPPEEVGVMHPFRPPRRQG